ncbi:MAG: DUF411 domain-containing protein [Methylococcales bacterium]|nr:DUF411 domain-containing protein [Methylococcaceae bacterium]
MKRSMIVVAMCMLVLIGCAGTTSTDIRKATASSSGEKPIDIVVYRSPTCACCSKWMDHLQENNFNVKEIRSNNEVQELKDKYGITAEISSCHTAIVDGYAIEGHVPADDIKALLKTKPKVTGISVPGMPIGTPGMEMGSDKETFDVLSFERGKPEQVFKSYKGN